MTSFDVVGLGICALDHLCLLPHHPRPDEKLDIVESSRQGGGPVPTAMVALSRLGARVSYVGKIADDDGGQFIQEELRREGVDVDHIVPQRGGSSPHAYIWVDGETGKKAIALDRTHIVDLRPEELDRGHILSGRFLLLDGRETEAALHAARWAQKACRDVVLDVGSLRRRMDELLDLTDYLVVSQRFAIDYTGQRELHKAAMHLFSPKMKAVVITQGEKGSICHSREGSFKKPAFPVKVVDTTGAGDVYHGAFIFGLLRGWDLERTVQFSNAVAAMKCRTLGGRAGIPRLQEVEQFLEERTEWLMSP